MGKYFCRLYFGLPGCGKTTMLARMAKAEDDKICKGTSRYKHVYGNVPLTGLKHYRQIDFDYLGVYQIDNALVLLDEASLDADNRDWKTFSKQKIKFFKLHRHYKTSIALFNQEWDGIDKKIRTVTDQVYYISANGLLGFIMSKTVRIPYGIMFPDPTNGSKYGDIIQGYAKPCFFSRLFAPRMFRPLYYKFFDSYEAPKLKPLPSETDEPKKAHTPPRFPIQPAEAGRGAVKDN